MEKRQPTRQQRRAAQRAGIELPQTSNGLRTRRNFIGLGLGAAALAGGGYLLLGNRDEDGEGQVTYPNPRLENMQPLPEITNDELQREVSLVIDHYEKITGVDVPKEEVLSRTILVGDAIKLSPKELEEYCPQRICFDPLLGGKALDDKSKILIYKDVFDYKLSQQVNDQRGKEIKTEVVTNIFSHELTHWLPRPTSISPELYQLVLKYYGDRYQNILEKVGNLSPTGMGAFLGGKRSDGPSGFSVMLGIEEAESEIISQYIVSNRGKKVYWDFSKDTEEPYFGIERSMMKKLLGKLNPNYGDTIRMLSTIRIKEGGREEYCRAIGKRFGATEETALENGFRILHAIDTRNVSLFDQLIGK